MEIRNMIRPSSAEAPAAAGVAAVTTRAPILLAEDDDELRRVIARTLRDEGYEITEASNGFDLLDRIEAAIAWGGRAHPPISLIISDVRMPGMTGIDVLSILRCAYWATPVILMSAFADSTMRLEAAELGAAAVIAKPFEFDELKTAVRNALRRAELQAVRSPSRRRSF
jgi:DNA-binding response OmpR family regulator